MRALSFFFIFVACSLTSFSYADDRDLTVTSLAYAINQYQSQDNARLLDWQQLMRAHHQSSIKKKLVWVNSFFNRVPYQTDKDNWGEEEYWATPIELLTLNRGDCEDYAIAKYFTLRAMGVPADRLRIVYVQSLTLKQPHMVLMYRSENKQEVLVLDNINDRIDNVTERRDLTLVYSFNSESLWLPEKRGGEIWVSGASRIKQWRKLLERMTGIASS